MTNISWNEIQDRATEFASKWQGETYEKGESQSFWSDFLSIYGIDRRRHGAFFEYAIKKGSGKQGFIDMFWPGKLLAEQKSGGKDLAKAGIQAYEYLETMPDHDLPEAIVVSDFATFQFIHLDTREKVDFTLEDLPKHVKLFGFLINQASKRIAEESPVNRQAAEAMASLHNQLRDDNYEGHDLEVLLVRLVFCMFADDSGIFDHGVLQEYLINRTNEDGSDLGPRLMQIFEALNTPIERRQSSLDEIIASLPYVNGGLFAEPIRTPYFTSAMRSELLVAMRLDWSKVSPAIFGSMFQGVMDEKQRRNLGAHYTSEKNILRVIKPLFLDDLYQEFASANAAGPRKKFDELRKLQDKLAGLRFLDPACGAGNFLVITYRELRRLEHKIVAILAKNADQQDMFASAGEGVGSLKVDVNQMYGIEIEEFPSLIAQTALWLTDHQMNMEYSHQAGRMFKRLPLKHSAKIVHDNALTLDWNVVTPMDSLDYILGNPPFIGSKMMTDEQREWATSLATPRDQDGNELSRTNLGVLDFVAGWFMRAAIYSMLSGGRIKIAFVATNSITQGEQAVILWRNIFRYSMEIDFAHRTFKWTNDARGAASVYCVIVGFSSTWIKDKRRKRIFSYPDLKSDPIEHVASNINAYLVDAPSIFIDSRSRPICDVTEIGIGNKPIDGGNYLFSEEERAEFIEREPAANAYFHKWIGSREFLHNENRYVLWLGDASPVELRQMPEVLKRIQAVRQLRLESKSEPTQKLADSPTRFHVENIPNENYIVIPEVSSERREYVPIGFVSPDVFASNLVKIIPNATLYHFGILTSRMHMAWVRTVAGRLKSDYRYSKDIVYNNFIWPEVTDAQKAEISNLAQAVLDARAQFPDSSLADLYDPLTMPPVLSKAHATLDKAVDKLYSTEPFTTDADRVALLFERYQEVSDK